MAVKSTIQEHGLSDNIGHLLTFGLGALTTGSEAALPDRRRMAAILAALRKG